MVSRRGLKLSITGEVSHNAVVQSLSDNFAGVENDLNLHELVQSWSTDGLVMYLHWALVHENPFEFGEGLVCVSSLDEDDGGNATAGSIRTVRQHDTLDWSNGFAKVFLDGEKWSQVSPGNLPRVHVTASKKTVASKPRQKVRQQHC